MGGGRKKLLLRAMDDDSMNFLLKIPATSSAEQPEWDRFTGLPIYLAQKTQQQGEWKKKHNFLRTPPFVFTHCFLAALTALAPTSGQPGK